MSISFCHLYNLCAFLHECAIQVVDVGRKQLNVKYHLVFRAFKLLLFLGLVSGIATLVTIYQLSARDFIICCFAFLPTGWGLLSVSTV